jgi:hypothetical protein
MKAFLVLNTEKEEVDTPFNFMTDGRCHRCTVSPFAESHFGGGFPVLFTHIKMFSLLMKSVMYFCHVTYIIFQCFCVMTGISLKSFTQFKKKKL